MPRKPPPRFVTGRMQAPPEVVPLTIDGTRLVGAREVPIDQVVPDPDQPRRTFPADTLNELAESIRRHGVLQALLVRADGVLEDGRTRYAIIDGERRWRAAQQVDCVRLPVLVRDEDDGETVRVLQLIANVQHEALDPIEEALAFRDMMHAQGLSTRDVGSVIGRSHMHVQRRLDLLFDERIVDAVRAGRLHPTVAAEAKSLPAVARAHIVERIATGAVVESADVRRLKREAKNSTRDHTQRPVPPTTVTVRYSDAPPAATPPSPDPVQGLYEAFKGWEVQVSQLPPDDLRRLVGLIHGDMQSFIASITEMTSHEREGAR